MTERDAFLAAIHAAPADDAPRLVYSDWLEEHGQPERAAFIRLQIDMWNEYHSRGLSSRLEGMFLRQKALFAGAWADVLRRCGAGAVSTYSRGFSTSPFSMTASAFAQEAAELVGWFGPDTQLTLQRCTGSLGQVAGCAELRWVHSLVLRAEWMSSQLADSDIHALCQSPYLDRLKELVIAGSHRASRPITAESCVALASAPSLTGLRTLNLSGNPIGDEGVLALAEGDNLRSLRSLILNGCGLTGDVADLLVEAPVFAGLTLVSVNNTTFSAAQNRRLTERFGWDLGRNRLRDLTG